MNNIEKISKFLAYFGSLDMIEITNKWATFGLDSIEKENIRGEIYFVGEGLKSSRLSNDNIIQKRYFYIDFDVRAGRFSKDGYVMTDEEVIASNELIKNAINEIDLLKDWTFIVFTGNGFHYHWIGDPIKIDKDRYKKAISFILDLVQQKFNEKGIDIKIDGSCKNIARLARVPYTINRQRTKYGLQPMENYVLEARKDIRTNIIDGFESLADFYGDDIEETTEEEKKEYISKYQGEDIFEAINNIPIQDLIYDYCGIGLQKNGKDFRGKDGGNAGMYLKGNCIAYDGTHYINEPKNGKHGYNPLSFIIEHYNLDCIGAVKWFCDKYRNIDDIDKKNKEERKKQKQIKEQSAPSENIDPIDHFFTFDKLLYQAAENRRKINARTICKYGIKGVDDYYVGILPDELVVIGAQPGVGKSEIAYNVATSNATDGKTVCLFSLEGNIEEPALRYLQRKIWEKTQITSAEYRFNLKDISEIENNVIEEISKPLKNNLLIFDKKTIPNISFIKNTIIKMKDYVDLFVIDHLHYIPQEKENENSAISEMVRELKVTTDIAKKPVVLVAHLRKPQRSRVDEKYIDPTEHDFLGTSNIAKEATTIVLVSKMTKEEHPKYVDDGLRDIDLYPTKIIVPKNRPGLPILKIAGAFHKNKKQYIDNMREPMDDSTLKQENRISFNL